MIGLEEQGESAQKLRVLSAREEDLGEASSKSAYFFSVRVSVYFDAWVLTGPRVLVVVETLRDARPRVMTGLYQWLHIALLCPGKLPLVRIHRRQCTPPRIAPPLLLSPLIRSLIQYLSCRHMHEDVSDSLYDFDLRKTPSGPSLDGDWIRTHVCKRGDLLFALAWTNHRLMLQSRLCACSRYVRYYIHRPFARAIYLCSCYRPLNLSFYFTRHALLLHLRYLLILMSFAYRRSRSERHIIEARRRT